MHSPYKGLMPYAESDAPFFFGRAAEQDIIIANMNVSRLTLLYGASGVGKSSVLRAGIAHQLRQDAQRNLNERGTPEFGVVVFSSWRDDPVQALIARVEDEIARTLLSGEETFHRNVSTAPVHPLTPSPHHPSLADSLNTNAQRVGGDLYIILDQFEEYFLYHPDDGGAGSSAGKHSFADEFARVLNRDDLRVNFLLAIREDALAKLDRFKGRIPNLFDNYLRMAHLDRDAAREAIVKPLDEYNRLYANGSRVEIEPALVDAVLEQTRTGQVIVGESGRGAVERAGGDEIETPYLQLVMTRLWDETMRADSHTLRLETLERLGGAEKIVRTHLDTTMGALPENEQHVAANIFNFLVTPSGTKIAHTAHDLANYAHAPQNEIAATLEKLSSGDVRILRPVAPPLDQPTEPRYEIFHDVLGAPILNWRTRFTQQQEKIESEKKLAAEKNRVRRLRFGLVGLSLLLLGVIALAVFALTQRQEAERASAFAEQQKAEALNQRDAAQKAQADANAQKELAEQEKKNAEAAKADAVNQQKIARSGELAALSLGQLESDPERALLIAREAMNTAQTTQAEDALRTVLLNPYRWTVKGGGAPILDALITPDGKYVIMWELCDRSTGLTVTCAPIRILNSDTGTIISSISPKTGTGAIDLSSDGRYLVTGDEDTVARVWEIPSGKLVSELRGHENKINDVHFSPDGKHILTSSDDATARIWDAAAGNPIQRFNYKTKLNVAIFSPDGSLVAGTDTIGFSIVDVETGELILQIPDLYPHDLEFSPDSQFIALSGGNAAPPTIWSLATGNKIAELKDTPSGVRSLAYSPSGRYILTGNDDGTLRVYDAFTGFNKANLPGHRRGIRDARFSADGKYAVSVGGDNSARWWQFKGNEVAPGTRLDQGLGSAPTDAILEPLQDLNGHNAAVNTAHFSLDGQSIITASDDSTARLWHVNPGEALEGHTDFVKQAAFSPDSKRVATAGKDGLPRVWETATGKTLFELRGHTGAINSIAYSPNGLYIVTAGDDGIARIWNSSDGSLVAELRGHSGHIVTAVFSPDSKTVTTGGEDQRIRIWSVPDGTLLANTTVGKSQFQNDYIPYTIAYSADAKHIVAAANVTHVAVFDTTNGEKVQSLRNAGQVFYSATYSPDGRLVAGASAPSLAAGHSIVTVWDAATGQKIAELRGHTAHIYDMVFSPDGKLVLTASLDKSARVWDANSGNLLHELKGHTAEITRAAFSPDGRFIITASNDKTARVWETATGKLIEILRGHSDIVTDAAFSPDGKTIVTTGDTTARLYECIACAPLDELLKLADARITRELTCEERVTFLHETIECQNP